MSTEADTSQAARPSEPDPRDFVRTRIDGLASVRAAPFGNRAAGLPAAFYAAFFDGAVVFSTSVMSAIGYHLILIGSLYNLSYYATVSTAFAAAFVLISWLRGSYERLHLDQIRLSRRESLRTFNIVFAFMVAMMFMSRATVIYSRGTFALQYLLGSAAIIVTRPMVARTIRRAMKRGRIQARSAVLVGSAASIQRFGQEFQPWNDGVRIAAVVTVPDAPAAPAPDRPDHACEAIAREVAEMCRTVKPDDVVLLLPWTAAELISAIKQRLMLLPVGIHLAPDRLRHWFQDPTVSQIGSVTTLRLGRPPLSTPDVFAKRSFDLVAATVILVLLAPLFAVVALLIKLDSSGPVFFRQQRHGFFQEPFAIYKFRSMTTLDDGPTIRQATLGDRRITRLGRILRRYNLDELPQLLNVVRGEMSLVGPRPHALAHNRQYEEEIALYARRHNVKPGITGWAQVHGLRGETGTVEAMKRRVEHDLFYIDNWSFLLDLRILAMTILSPDAYRNAY